MFEAPVEKSWWIALIHNMDGEPYGEFDMRPLNQDLKLLELLKKRLLENSMKHSCGTIYLNWLNLSIMFSF